VIKRSFDILLAIIGIVLLIPFYVLISLVIIGMDGVPVLFKQARVGRNRKPFTLYKFRTMTVLKSAQQGSFDAGNSSRVTGIGRILRKTKLDEIPQLFNVLKGDMSFVGPRPEVEKWTQIYEERWDKVLTVRPGITDNASIEFRNEEEILSQSEEPFLCYKQEILPRKLSLYEDYINNRSLLNDLAILFKTLSTIITK